MCTGIEIALIAGTALSAGAAVKQGIDTNEGMKAQGRQQEADAAAERGRAAVQADMIRKAAERKRASVVSQQAASGVKIDAGSAGDVESYITESGEYDALSELIGGNYRGRRLEGDAAMSRIAGRNAMTTGVLTGAGTVLGNYGMAYSRGYIQPRNTSRPVGLARLPN